jgi:transposase
MLGCDDQTVRNVQKRFEQDGLAACSTRRSSRPQPGPRRSEHWRSLPEEVVTAREA